MLSSRKLLSVGGLEILSILSIPNYQYYLFCLYKLWNAQIKNKQLFWWSELSPKNAWVPQDTDDKIFLGIGTNSCRNMFWLFLQVSPLYSEVGLVRNLRPNDDFKPAVITVDYKTKAYQTTRYLQAAWSIKITTCWAQFTENVNLCSPQAQNETISSPFFYFNCPICHSWVPGALHFNVQQSTSILSKFSKVLASEIIVPNSHFNQLILHHCTQTQLDSPKRGKTNHCNNYLITAITTACLSSW